MLYCKNAPFLSTFLCMTCSADRYLQNIAICAAGDLKEMPLSLSMYVVLVLSGG